MEVPLQCRLIVPTAGIVPVKAPSATGTRYATKVGAIPYCVGVRCTAGNIVKKVQHQPSMHSQLIEGLF